MPRFVRPLQGRGLPPGFVLSLLLASLAAVAWTAPAAAGVDRWTPVSPPGGTVRSLLVDPSAPGRLYAVSADAPGLLVTLDGGRRWLPVRGGLPLDAAVERVVLDASRPSTLYAVIVWEGSYELYRSLDAGATWAPRSHLPAGPALVVAAGEPDLLFTAGPTDPYGPGRQVFRSRDGGAAWEPVLNLPNGFGSSRLYADPVSAATLYLVDGDGLLRSTDGGASWTERGPTLEPGPHPVSVSRLAIAPSAPEVLYLFGNVAYRSDDGGASWRELVGPPCDHTQAVVHPVRPRTLYMRCSSRLFRSRDGAGSWEEVAVAPAGPAPGFQDLAIDPFAPRTLYVATTALGVFRTRDAGASWTPASGGLRGATVRSLAIDPWEPRTLYAVTAGLQPFRGAARTLLWSSLDGGESWTRRLPGWNAAVNQLVPDPHRSGTVYVATAEGLFAWEPGGGAARALWQHEVVRLAVDPADPDLFYAAGAWGLHRSEDAGRSWTETASYRPGSFVDELVADPSMAGRVYAVTRYGGVENRLHRSDDGGWTWIEPVPWYYGDRHLFLVPGATPGAASTLYAGTDRSTDGGESWQPTGFPGAMVAVVPGAPATLYVQGSGGPSRSRDGGATWRPVTSLGALTEEAGERLVAHPAAPERLYRYGATRHAGLDVAQVVGSRPLVVQEGRFEARAAWRDGAGRFGPARPEAISGQAGAFTLPGRRRVLGVLDLLDLRAEEGRFRVIGAPLLPLEATVTVFDRATGLSRDLVFPADRASSRVDGESFPPLGEPPGWQPPEAPWTGAEVAAPGRVGDAPALRAGCEPSATALCLLGGRFRVEVFRRVGAVGPRLSPLAYPAPIGPLLWDAGSAWFDEPGVPSVAVQLLAPGPPDGRVGVAVGGLSEEPYVVWLQDLATGASRRYVHPAGAPASVADPDAFGAARP